MPAQPPWPLRQLRGSSITLAVAITSAVVHIAARVNTAAGRTDVVADFGGGLVAAGIAGHRS